MSEPRNLSPREACERYLAKRSVSTRESTISTYHYRLKLFLEWCEEEGIDSMQDLSGWDVESYETARRAEGISPLTLNQEMTTLRDFITYCARIEVVDEDLPEKVDVPAVPYDKRSSEVRLDHHAARAILEYLRKTPDQRGTRGHALLELAWFSGARVGGLRALDVRDYDVDAEFVRFEHRPDTGTPLKNGLQGERPVSIPAVVCDAVDRYLRVHRHEAADGYGRQPLLTSRAGRPTPGTIRDWMYRATIPCQHGPCPHDKDPATCDWTAYTSASKCPSSRSPHQVRTGAITWMLDCGMPADVVAARVNASVDVIERHYDKGDPVEEMEARRRPFLDHLTFNGDDST